MRFCAGSGRHSMNRQYWLTAERHGMPPAHMHTSNGSITPGLSDFISNQARQRLRSRKGLAKGLSAYKKVIFSAIHGDIVAPQESNAVRSGSRSYV
jgi:hypothetical protein